MHIFLLCLILATVFVQGGFFPTVILLASACLSGAGILNARRRPGRCVLILAALAAVYLVCSAANGYSAPSLAQACLPAACAACLYLCGGLSKKQHEQLLDWLIIASGVLAGVSILAFCGVIHMDGAVTDRRLQTTFQYANAAGAWFAAVSLLAQDRQERRVRAWLLPNLAAMLLTRSVGAVGLYAVFQLVRLILRRTERALWQTAVLTHALAGAFAAGLFLLPGWPSLPVLALLYAAGWGLDRALPVMRRLRLHWVCVALGAGAVILAARSVRLANASGTFIERLIQIRDGSSVILHHPLIGIGAGRWAELYPYIQTAQYTSTVVHSSLIQLGVDAGVPAMALGVFFCVSALRTRGRPRPWTLAAVYLLAHSLLDFTLQFFPICALLLLLLSESQEQADAKPQKKGAKRPPMQKLRVGAAAMFACMLVISSALLYVEQVSKQYVRATQSASWDVILTRYPREKNIFGHSTTILGAVARAQSATGDYAGVIRTTGDAPMTETSLLLLRARALYAEEGMHSACRFMLSELERQLYRKVLFEQVAQQIIEWDADAQYFEEYNRIADRANESRTALAARMQSQVTFEHIRKQP